MPQRWIRMTYTEYAGMSLYRDAFREYGPFDSEGAAASVMAGFVSGKPDSNGLIFFKETEDRVAELEAELKNRKQEIANVDGLKTELEEAKEALAAERERSLGYERRLRDTADQLEAIAKYVSDLELFAEQAGFKRATDRWEGIEGYRVIDRRVMVS